MVNIISKKYYLALFTSFLFYHSPVILSQSYLNSAEVNPDVYNKKVEQNPPVNEAIWDVVFNYDATVITGAAGNAGVVYIPTINKFWTSRWATNIIHQWNTDGTLDMEFTLPFAGTRGMCFDGQYVYHATATTTVQIVDPSTRTVVGTVPVVGAPNGARSITYNPDADGGNGGIIVGNWTSPNLNFYEFSMTGTLLRTIINTVAGVYGIAYDNWTAGAPFLWVFTVGNGQGTPQFIQQLDYNTGLYTGIQHDVKSDVGLAQPSTGIAGGMFITDQLITGELIMGGILQGTPDLLFGYRLGGPPCPVQPATNPSPANGTTGVDINAPGNATWTNGAGTNNIEVFFGPAGNVVSVYSGAPMTSYTIPTPLQYATTYQWRVVCKNDMCSAYAETWTFETQQDPSMLILFEDDFENGTVNWTITNDGGTVVWQVFTPPYPNTYTLPPAATGGVFAADVDQAGSTATLLSTATIITPFDFSNNDLYLIEFDNDWQALDSADYSYVELSIDGFNWTAVRTFDVNDVRSTRESIDISLIVRGQSQVYIRLRSVQPGWDWWWVVDNIRVIQYILVPVELLSFTIETNNMNVYLKWSTGTETNNSGFQIERSSGSEFENVGFVAGHGTTTEIQNYSFVDQNVVAGYIYLQTKTS